MTEYGIYPMLVRCREALETILLAHFARSCRVNAVLLLKVFPTKLDAWYPIS